MQDCLKFVAISWKLVQNTFSNAVQTEFRKKKTLFSVSTRIWYLFTFWFWTVDINVPNVPSATSCNSYWCLWLPFHSLWWTVLSVMIWIASPPLIIIFSIAFEQNRSKDMEGWWPQVDAHWVVDFYLHQNPLILYSSRCFHRFSTFVSHNTSFSGFLLWDNIDQSQSLFAWR